MKTGLIFHFHTFLQLTYKGFESYSTLDLALFLATQKESIQKWNVNVYFKSSGQWTLETLPLKAHWLINLQNQWKTSRLQVIDNRPNHGLNHVDIYCSLMRNQELVSQGWFRSVSKPQSSSWSWLLLFVFISRLDDCWQHLKTGSGGQMEGNQLLYSSVSYQKSTTKAKSFMCRIVYIQVAWAMSHDCL